MKGEKFVLPEDKKEAGFSDTVTKDQHAIEEANGSFDFMKVNIIYMMLLLMMRMMLRMML